MHDTPSNISKTFYNEFHYTSLKISFNFDASKNLRNTYYIKAFILYCCLIINIVVEISEK